jgi:hemerythrin-like domain-containing protein
MCEHCGCRGVEPVAELMDEHFALLEVSDEVRRSLAAQDRGEVRRLLERAGRMLARHVSREEAGIFAALEEQGDFVDAVRELEAEHIDFDRQLACLDGSTPDFAAAVHRLLDELAEHVEKENLGFFPVAVVTLGAHGWETVGRAHEAQPSFLVSAPS